MILLVGGSPFHLCGQELKLDPLPKCVGIQLGQAKDGLWDFE